MYAQAGDRRRIFSESRLAQGVLRVAMDALRSLEQCWTERFAHRIRDWPERGSPTCTRKQENANPRAAPELPQLSLASLVKKATPITSRSKTSLGAFRELAYPDLTVANAGGRAALGEATRSPEARVRTARGGARGSARRDCSSAPGQPAPGQGVAGDPGLEPL